MKPLIYPYFMDKNSYITADAVCTSYSPTKVVKLNVFWILKTVNCMEEMYNAELGRKDLQSIIEHPKQSQNDTGSLMMISYQMATNETFACSQNKIFRFKDYSGLPYNKALITNNKHRQLHNPRSYLRQNKYERKRDDVLTTTWDSAMYHFALFISPEIKVENSFQFQAKITVHGPYGYLSAYLWPYLGFEGTMSLIYTCLMIYWTVIWLKKYRQSTKIHIVIAIVTIAGSFGHTLYFVSLLVENITGYSPSGISWFSKGILAIQLGATKFLFLIISTGYGITRYNFQVIETEEEDLKGDTKFEEIALEEI
ncbi:DgyrCDS13591 [Dimorphilus gyrociliatus]|uniref:DgyrCDS13591 n=1 Tax=Dimorphilus gyrociliatus TaxID=2664684 RepID=A0A7I8WB28_9ANNE|nr:DgyrCDS13591 [Dimorphilus gyrociliatus]